MITITANARRATFKSDDLITSGSVGIPVEFVLSDDFDGLSSIAVFEGSGASVDIALMSDTCVVPPEVVATAGGYLRIGVYARNSEGSIVIPTVWVSTQVILPGAEPSGVDPSQPTPDWTAQVQEAAAEALSIAQSIEQRADEGAFDGEPGLPGQDGFSPTATVTQTSTGATISVTDAHGTTTAEITNGQDGTPGAPGAPGTPGTPGEDGISPTITVTDITGGHRVTITDADGPHSFDVMDGEDGGGAVQDVQVNGTSILDAQGVANVPVAEQSRYGVVRFSSDYGLQNINVSGNLRLGLLRAALAETKIGTNNFKPIVPSNQHESTFFGLAKAAGDTTQSASSNAVGTYTDEAKVAIQKMLGVNRSFELINEIAVDADIPTLSPLTISTDSSSESFALDAVNVFIIVPATSYTTMNGSIGVMKNGVASSIGLRFTNFGHASYAMNNMVSLSLAKYGLMVADLKSQIPNANSIYTGLVKWAPDTITADYIDKIVIRDNIIPAGTVIQVWGHRI